MAFFKISLPAALWPFRRYGLVVDEQKVTFVSWKKGSFEKLGEFVNDNQGLSDFETFLRARPKLRNRNIGICVSVVGEDYRYEKVAHLVGKYRSDMLKRKFQQLFRGSTYQMAIQHDREPVGRRQDLFLFAGILSNEKVQPWVRELGKSGMNLTGVHLGSMLTASLLKIVAKDVASINVVSLVTEAGWIRHNFYINGDMRFSRLSRYNDDGAADEIYGNIRNELEKTVAYLTSVKLLQATAKINVSLICSDDMVDGINDVAARSESDRYVISALSARIVGGAVGIKNPVEEYGRDNSLILNEMLRSLFINQMAPIGQIRYYLMQSGSLLLGTLAVVWAIFNLTGISLNALNSYNTYGANNVELQSSIAKLKGNYQNQVSGFGTPPSSPTNMRSAVNVLDNSTREGGGPGKMILYLSTLMSKYTAFNVDSFNWYISNDRERNTGELSFANGRKTYEVVQIAGKMNESFDAQIAFNQYKDMIAEIRSRADMTVIEDIEPALIEAGGALNITIDTRKDIKSELNKLNISDVSFTVAWDSSLDLEPAAAEGQ